jgi:hypothetical protein
MEKTQPVDGHYPAVDGQCPRCGTYVSETSRFCRECLLQLVPGEDLGAGQTNLLRAAWERDHPEIAAAFAAWTANPEGPPPGVTNPYKPPEQERILGPWVSLDGRLKAVVIAFSALIFAILLATVSTIMEMGLMGRVVDGESVSNADLTANDDREALALALYMSVLLACAIVFIVWFHGAYKNVDALPDGVRRYETWWAIGGWFIPIMWFFRPKQIANDLWNSGAKSEDDRYPPFLLLAWWVLFLASTTYLNRRGGGVDDSPQELIDADKLELVFYAVDVVAAVLAILVAKRITERLKARRAEVSQPAPEAALPA